MECVQRYKFDDDQFNRSCFNGAVLAPDSDQEGEESEAEETPTSTTEQSRTQDISTRVTAVQEDGGSFPPVSAEGCFPQPGFTNFPALSYDFWPQITNFCQSCGFTTHNFGFTATTGPTIASADTVKDPWLDCLGQPTVEECDIKQEYAP